ncbi:uncharacterized protein LOC105636622 [Jatropha curcas]|uniref:uncharacterized protein LOC105636622 n=1 Tax=Jatropha curcas TaxID=180498 RepID=UPI0005FB9962|nr:uncharacterized protein LOC105636622 [Jatropha curcas]
MNDLVFVMYNLKLKEKKAKPYDEPTSFEELPYDDEWIAEEDHLDSPLATNNDCLDVFGSGPTSGNVFGGDDIDSAFGGDDIGSAFDGDDEYGGDENVNDDTEDGSLERSANDYFLSFSLSLFSIFLHL